MRQTLLSTLAVGLLLSVGREAAAQEAEMKPLLVVASAGFNELIEDMNFVGDASGMPELGTSLEGMLDLFTQGQGLGGLDKDRPWGMTVSTDGGSFQILGSIPPLEEIDGGRAAEDARGGGEASSEESLDSLPPLLGTRGDNGGSGGANITTGNDNDASEPVESGPLVDGDTAVNERASDDSSEGASVPSLQDAGASSSDESSMPSLEEIDDGGDATSSPGAPNEMAEVSRDDSSEACTRSLARSLVPLTGWSRLPSQ